MRKPAPFQIARASRPILQVRSSRCAEVFFIRTPCDLRPRVHVRIKIRPGIDPLPLEFHADAKRPVPLTGAMTDKGLREALIRKQSPHLQIVERDLHLVGWKIARRELFAEFTARMLAARQ